MREEGKDSDRQVKVGVILFIDLDKYLESIGDKSAAFERQFISPLWHLTQTICRKYQLEVNRSFGDALLISLDDADQNRAFLALTSFISELRDSLSTRRLTFKAAAVRGPFIDEGSAGDALRSLIGPAANLAGKLISQCPRNTLLVSWAMPDLPPHEMSYFDLSAHAMKRVNAIPIGTVIAAKYSDSMGLPFIPHGTDDTSDADNYHPRSEFNGQTKSHIIEMLKLADDKAKLIFGLSGAFLVYLFNRHGVEPELVKYATTLRLDRVVVALQTLGIVGFLSSCAFSLLVIIPRTTTNYRGLVFFGSIAAWASPEDYASQVMYRSRYALDLESAKHNYEMSLVNMKKYRALRRCIVSTTIALALVLIAFAIEKAVTISPTLLISNGSPVTSP
jgi:hypothetical protein